MIKNQLRDGSCEWIYDIQNDLLHFKIKEREYDFSLEFENFVMDVDTQGFITGISIFDATKIFSADKNLLKNIHKIEFQAEIKRGILSVLLRFISTMRNKEFQYVQNILMDVEKIHLSDSVVDCMKT